MENFADRAKRDGVCCRLRRGAGSAVEPRGTPPPRADGPGEFGCNTRALCDRATFPT